MRKRHIRGSTLSSHLALCGLLLCPSIAAAANPNDVLWGKDIELDKLRVSVDGQYATTQGMHIKKQANSLNVSIPLSALGLPSSGNLHATGTTYGNKILWQFNQNVNINLGGSNDLKKIQGWIEVSVAGFSPAKWAQCSASSPCSRNAKLSLNAASVVIKGDGFLGFDWAETVYVHAFDATGGVRVPGVAYIGGPTELNAEANDYGTIQHTQGQMVLYLSSVSPSSGTTVTLDASILPGLNFVWPQTLFVPAGAKWKTFALNAYPGFIGSVNLVATGPANQVSRDFTILPPVPEGKDDPFDIREEVPWWELLLQCLVCTDPLGWLDDLGPLVQFEDELLLYGNDGPVVVQADQLWGAQIEHVGRAGWLTGVGEDGGAFAGRLSGEELTQFSRLDHSAQLEHFEPVSIDSAGSVAGQVIDAEGYPFAAVWVQGTEQALDLGVPAKGSFATAMSEGGYIVGSTLEGDAFVTYAGLFSHMVPRPDGAQRVVLEAVNGAGLAAGFVEVERRRHAAFVGREGQVHLVEGLKGFEDSTVVAITPAGDLLINARSEDLAQALVWQAHTQELRPLDDFLFRDSGLSATHVQSISTDTTLVVDTVSESGDPRTFAVDVQG